MALGKIWVFAEVAGGKPAPVALELLTKARSLAGTVEAVAFAPDAAEAAAELGAHGATTLYAGTDPLWGEVLLGGPAADALAALIEEHKPDLVLFGMTYNSRDVAGRLAAKLGVPVIANGLDVSDGDGISVHSSVVRSDPQRRDALRGRGSGPRDHPAEVVRGRAERGRRRRSDPGHRPRSTRSTRPLGSPTGSPTSRPAPSWRRRRSSSAAGAASAIRRTSSCSTSSRRCSATRPSERAERSSMPAGCPMRCRSARLAKRSNLPFTSRSASAARCSTQSE